MDPLETILDENDQLKKIADQAKKYDLQILYTQIDRDAANQPTFTNYAFGIDTLRYFYPASTIKMPTAFLALEKLNQLHSEYGIDHQTALRIDSVRSPQTAVLTDSSSANLLPSIGHYVKKVFLVSNNDAQNRMYEFLGQDGLNKALREKGYHHSRVVHRIGVGGFGPEENRYTNPITFYDGDKVLYRQAEGKAIGDYSLPLKDTQKGVGYIGEEDQLIKTPKDFSQKNFISVPDLHQLLKAVIFPEAVAPAQRFDLTEADYRLLYQYMSSLPRESKYPEYGEEEYDSYVKFFIFGDSKAAMPDHIRIFNKVGFAYGFLTDCAYIVDFENKVEFLLTASMQVNENQTYNDNQYEYETVGFPFLAELGRAVYDYEKKRKKKHLPDLSKFVVQYD